MQLTTITLPNQAWRGIKSKYPADLAAVSPDDFLSGSKNFDTDITGAITKRGGGLPWDITPSAHPAKDFFEAIFTDGVHHGLKVDNGVLRYTSGNQIFNDVTSGFSATGNFEFGLYNDRVYGDNGIDNPLVYDKNPSYGGVTYTVPKTKDMGCQVPGSAPVASLHTDATVSQIPAGGHTYKVTFLYYGEEESNGGPVSNLVTNDASHTSTDVTLAIGGYGVTARKLYRDNNDGLWRLVATISNNTTTTFQDKASIGTAIVPAANGLPPKFTLNVFHLDRQFVAGVPGDPSNVFFSQPGFPDIFDSNTGFVTANSQDPITGLIVYNQKLLILNRHSLGWLLGSQTSDFRYVPIPGIVGCVDNRTIQIRTFRGVPVVVWLSDKGFYQFNGQSVDYISDDIEDQINFNIQQASQVKGRNSQNTQAQFLAGTASPGIDLVTDPGIITTHATERIWQSQPDWEGGSSLVNVSTKDGSNLLKVPTQFNPLFTDGTFNNALTSSQASDDTQSDIFQVIQVVDVTHLVVDDSTDMVVGDSVTQHGHSTTITGIFDATHITVTNTAGWTDATTGNLFLSTFVGSTGENTTGTPSGSNGFARLGVTSAITAFAEPIQVVRAGSIDRISFTLVAGTSCGSFVATIWNDAGGVPGSVVWSQSFTPVFNVGTTYNFFPAFSVTAGKWYFGFTYVNVGSGSPNQLAYSSTAFSGGTALVGNTGGSWTAAYTFGIGPQTPITSFLGLYTFTEVPISESGQWTSPIWDTFSVTIGATLHFAASGTFPTGTSVVALVQGTNTDPSASPVWTTTDTLTNPTGTLSLTGTGFRWWRVLLTLSTAFSNSGITPLFNRFNLQFALIGVWTSEVIDHTTDVVSLDQLTITDTVPAGTTLVLEIATSTDNITYTAFGPFSGVVVHRYSKIRVTLTASTGDVTTPSVTSLVFSWTLNSNIISTAIDTGLNPPAGWELFQASFTLNGGTVTFFVRTAATALGLSSATFVAVTNGSFIPATSAEFIQWKAVFVSNAANAAEVSSITINWFINNINSIRATSIFFNKSYFVSLAFFNSTVNNVVFKLDSANTWKIYQDINVGVFSYFFNAPYYGDAAVGQVKSFLNAVTDEGVAISMDVRFPLKFGARVANDMDDKMKVLKGLTCIVTGTGATFQFFFSLDNGQTWISMHSPLDGSTNFTVPNDGKRYIARMSPIFTDTFTPMSRLILLRIVESTSAQAEIRSMKVRTWIRDQEQVNTINA